ncbi:MAG: biopolymer transporter ExbD [Treponema sp.]|jgi:biopolymer transport protein ExbD|nr:biopolymer transporter ExbD [Treponema sp.]
MRIIRKKKNFIDGTSASSDLAFLLIIYFIVTAVFNVNRGFIVTLPAKDSSRLILKDDLLRFELDGAGRLFFQGAFVDKTEAQRTIGAALAYNPNIAVALSVDPLSPWQQVVSFVELAQALEVEAFSFSMKGFSAGGER